MLNRMLSAIYVNLQNTHFLIDLADLLKPIATRLIALEHRVSGTNRSGLTPYQDDGPEVIISLTSIPGRMDSLLATLECLMRQDQKSNRILLWLSEADFSSETIAQSLGGYIERGLDVRLCPDLGPHTKYIYTALEYPDAAIVTADDDILYPENWLSNLLKAYKKYPNCISCYRAHEMQMEDSHHFLPYSEWVSRKRLRQGPSFVLLPTGVSGILYPPNSIRDMACNISNIKNLSLYNDDLWLHYMTTLAGYPVVTVYQHNIHWLCRHGSQKVALAYANTGKQARNDIYLQLLQANFEIDWKQIETTLEK